MKISTLITLVVAILVALLLSLVLPGQAYAGDQRPDANVNARYDVEAVTVTGVSPSRLSQALRDDMQRMVDAKYNPETAYELADRMRKELPQYRVVVRVRRGQEPEHVKVVFEASRQAGNAELMLPQLFYDSNAGFSGGVSVGVETHHNVFGVSFVNSADELIERNAGWGFRYEHRRVGTDILQVKLEYARYHQTFPDATVAAAAVRPGAPEFYRTRESFAPTVSVVPYPGLTFSAGVNYQSLEVKQPASHTVKANAVTAAVQYRGEFSGGGALHAIAAEYDLRAGIRALDSDLVYTRHLASADYTASVHRHVFGAHARYGSISGDAPFFERFSLGNAALLRGWDKLDVAPLGGTRLAYGSLEYRYRPVRIFYDVGAVWEPAASPITRHAVGVGLVSRDGFFLTVGFPARMHDVKPAVMIGFRRELP